MTWLIIQVHSTFHDTELLWLIASSANSDEIQIGQLYDWLYRCSILQKRNRVVVIDRNESSLWQKPDSYYMIDRIGLVYVKIETKLLGHI